MRSCCALLVMGCFVAPAVAADMPHAAHDHAAMAGMTGKARPSAWTAYPTLKTRMSGKSHESMTASVVPQNIVANGIEAWSNNLKDENGHRQLALEMGGVKLDKPSSGGFHWLAAREESGDKVNVASTVYYFGERGAQDPTAMFMQQKYELEIIPQPYPREHSRYRANEDWKFLVRFNGKPLAGQKIVLETQNGSKAEFISGVQGVAKVHLPGDFKAEEAATAGGHSMRSADFALAAEHVAGGKIYLTTFNAAYGPDAFDKRSLAMGLGFMLLGGACAVPLLRQRKKEQKKEEAGHA